MGQGQGATTAETAHDSRILLYNPLKTIEKFLARHLL
jgi:phage terminase large subunit-like protein